MSNFAMQKLSLSLNIRASRIAAAIALAALPLAASACTDSSAEVITVGARAGDLGERGRTAERLVALFDYVASDYAGAVEAGAIVSQFEYDEQLRLVEDMRRFAAELGAPPRERLDDLERAIRAKAPAPAVAERCAGMRREVVAAFDVAVAPAAPPDLARAADLYRSRCAECHALDGSGRGERAPTLDPPPANLLDPDRMAGVTPYRAYCAITYGIEGTSMFGHALPASDRWSLAFYAVAMRHAAARAPAASQAKMGRGPAVPKFGLATLANETDEGLAKLLEPWVDEATVRTREVARLRAVAPFEAEVGETPIALARRLLAEAREAAARGDAREADRLVLDAYLRGVEEIEGPLLARDLGGGAALVGELEGAVAVLRASILRGAPDIEARAARLGALLDRAESANDRSKLGPLMLASAGALLILREGLEAALVVASVLAVVRRTGETRGRRAVHAGWTLALVAGIATFVLARTVITSLLVAREAIEGAVSLLAAGVLFATSFWLLSKADAQRWLAYLKRRAAAAGTVGAGAFFGLGWVAFLAVYREAFETVLFFEALAGGDRGRVPPLAGGAAAGAAALTVAIYLLLRAERRLPIAPFFALSGAALSGLAVILLGHGVHALQQTRVLAPHPVGFPRIALLGVYPDAVSLAAQAGLIAVIAVATAVVLLRQRATERAPAAGS